MYVIKWFLSNSFSKFLLAILLSIASGSMTVGVLIALFRAPAESDDAKFWLFSLLSFGAVVSRVAARSMVGSISRDAVSQLRAELCRRISSVPLINLEWIGPSRLLTALTDDIGRVAIVFPNLTMLFTNLSLIIGCLAYLAWLSAVHLLITLTVIAIGVVCHAVMRRKGVKQMRITRQRSDQIAETVANLIRGAKEMKLNLEQRKLVLEQLTQQANYWSVSAGEQSAIFGGSEAIIQSLFYVALGFAIFGFADGMDRHLIASYGVAIALLMAPLQNAIQTVEALSEASVALNRVEELGLLLGDDRQERIDATKVSANDPALEFRELELCDIGYSYPSMSPNEQANFTVGPINLILKRGEILFVVGGNGSGKTTFMKLLTGLYSIETGTIRINGQHVSTHDPVLYRRHFSAIFHDAFLFDNFPRADFERLQGLLSRFEISGRVRVEAGKLHGLARLSSGERKRLALVLAYLEDRPVYIFDEWAADQDPFFKEIFYHDILGELQRLGKLVVVISHDDRYFHLADKILKFERGTVPQYELRARH